MSEQAQQIGPMPVPQSVTVGEVKGGGQGRIADVAMHAKTGLVIASGLNGLAG